MEYREDEFTDALIEYFEKMNKNMRTRVIVKRFSPFLLERKGEWFNRNFMRKMLYHLRFES